MLKWSPLENAQVNNLKVKIKILTILTYFIHKKICFLQFESQKYISLQKLKSRIQILNI